MAKFNLKDQLAGIAALIAAIVAIGGGFVQIFQHHVLLRIRGQTSQHPPGPLDPKFCVHFQIFIHNFYLS